MNPMQHLEFARNCGRGWAKNSAPAKELERMKALAEGCDIDRWLMEHSASSAARLYWTISPQHDGDRDAAAGFWQHSLADYEEALDADDPLVVAAFMEGALTAASEGCSADWVALDAFRREMYLATNHGEFGLAPIPEEQ